MFQVFVISMEKDSERRQNCKKILDNLGLQYEFFIANPHPKGGIYGCFDSHIQVWKKITNNFAIIFEDDIRFVSNVQNFYKTIEKYKSLSDKIDTLHLHDYYLPYTFINNYQDDDIINSNIGLTTHAYIINKNYIDKCLKNSPEAKGIHFDSAQHLKVSDIYSDKIYYTKEPLFLQDEKYQSNICKNFSVLQILKNSIGFDTQLRMFFRFTQIFFSNLNFIKNYKQNPDEFHRDIYTYYLLCEKIGYDVPFLK